MIAVDSVTTLADREITDVSSVALQTLGDTATLIGQISNAVVLTTMHEIASLGAHGTTIANRGIDGLVSFLPTKQGLQLFFTQNGQQHASVFVLPSQKQYCMHITAEKDLRTALPGK
jgi:hypothetical protein